MSRTALLIRCSKDEADWIRTEAEKERCTLSSYLLNIMIRNVEIEKRVRPNFSQPRFWIVSE